MKKIKHFMLPPHTNELYTKEAISSISLTRDVADKINEIVDAFNALDDDNLVWKHEQEGRIRKGVLYMKDNLLNTLHELLKLYGEDETIRNLMLSMYEELTSIPITPLMFGAKGDGITDDTKAINQCLRIGGNIDFFGKTYLVDPIEFQNYNDRKYYALWCLKPTTIRNGNFILKEGEKEGLKSVFGVNCSGVVVFDNVTINGQRYTHSHTTPYQDGGMHGIHIMRGGAGGSTVIKNSTIYNCYSDGILHSCGHLTVDNTYLYECGRNCITTGCHNNEQIVIKNSKVDASKCDKMPKNPIHIEPDSGTLQKVKLVSIENCIVNRITDGDGIYFDIVNNSVYDVVNIKNITTESDKAVISFINRSGNFKHINIEDCMNVSIMLSNEGVMDNVSIKNCKGDLSRGTRYGKMGTLIIDNMETAGRIIPPLCEKLIVKNSKFSNTYGTAQSDHIIFFNAQDKEIPKNIEITGCEFSNCNGAIYFFKTLYGERIIIDSCVFKNCRFVLSAKQKIINMNNCLILGDGGNVDANGGDFVFLNNNIFSSAETDIETDAQLMSHNNIFNYSL